MTTAMSARSRSARMSSSLMRPANESLPQSVVPHPTRSCARWNPPSVRGMEARPGGKMAPVRDADPEPLAFAPDDEAAWQRLARGYRLAGLLLSAHRLGLLQRL